MNSTEKFLLNSLRFRHNDFSLRRVFSRFSIRKSSFQLIEEFSKEIRSFSFRDFQIVFLRLNDLKSFDSNFLFQRVSKGRRENKTFVVKVVFFQMKNVEPSLNDRFLDRHNEVLQQTFPNVRSIVFVEKTIDESFRPFYRVDFEDFQLRVFLLQHLVSIYANKCFFLLIDSSNP